MFGGIPSPASRIMTLLRPLPSSFAINAPAKPEPTIATSHNILSISPTMIYLPQEFPRRSHEIGARVRRARPITELHFAEPHRMGLGHPQRPCLGIGFRRNDFECRRPLRIFEHIFADRLEFVRLVPGAQVPHQ